MVSVIIHANEDIDPLADTLAMLVSGSVFGLVSEVILWSENHSNVLKTIADDTGCRYLSRSDLGTAIMAAKSTWLLFLVPGTRLLDQWREILSRYIEKETRPAQFRLIGTKKFTKLRRFLGINRQLEGGLLITKNQISSIYDNQTPLHKYLRRLNPVILPIQILDSSQ